MIKRRHAVSLLLLLIVYAGVTLCSGFNQSVNLPRSQLSDTAYAGNATCINCHKAVYDSFIGTAHYLTSRPASDAFIKGSFEEGKNHFTYNQFVEVKLEKKDGGFYQTAYINGEATHSESMDIVVGSGKKGQTYLYWKENLLYQLPVSYFVPTKTWCNSPGYPPGLPRFNRLIPARCLECHGSGAVVEDAGNNVNFIDKASVVYGINCERCHGPSASHVAWHLSHPEEKKIGHNILNEKLLTRQQNLDRCALCHSGVRNAIKPTFSFVAGDKLEDFSLPKYNTDSVAKLDVHGNQYGLMTSSKCFQNSQMNCSSCHNVHGKEVGNAALFSSRCMNCHNNTTQIVCKVKPEKNIVLSDNCIDCHMPLLPSKAIFLQLEDRSQSTADFVRSHRIAIYPDAVKEFIKQSKQKKKS
ncbi:MAG: multiheme c-type cytochrome [Chitinophagaceae bacterium]